MAEGAIVFVLLVFGFGAVVILFLLVRAESNRRERMTREDAERVARRDTRPENDLDSGGTQTGWRR